MQRMGFLNCILCERTVSKLEKALPLSDTEIEAVYARHADTVYRVSFSFMKNRAEAEDIVQETFLKLISRRMRFQSPEHEKAWLIVTASNLCKNALKHWWRKNEDIDGLANVTQEYDFETGETIRAIMALPPDYKAVVYMYYYEGYSTPEIAQFTGAPQTTVRSRLYRARKLLKNMLGGELNEPAGYSQSL